LTGSSSSISSFYEWIEKVASTADRRTQRIELTTAGWRTLEQMEAHFDVWADRLLAQIPPSELATVADALGHITAALLADMRHMKDMKERK
jgi:DNA-binding MarR family transcriptional regulator